MSDDKTPPTGSAADKSDQSKSKLIEQWGKAMVRKARVRNLSVPDSIVKGKDDARREADRPQNMSQREWAIEQKVARMEKVAAQLCIWRLTPEEWAKVLERLEKVALDDAVLRRKTAPPMRDK
jgi:hypothetical protein